MATTTIVRIAVARLDPTPSIPTFASIEVSAAKTAEPRANQNHILKSTSDIREIPFHIRYQFRIVLLHQDDQFMDISDISADGIQSPSVAASLAANAI